MRVRRLSVWRVQSRKRDREEFRKARVSVFADYPTISLGVSDGCLTIRENLSSRSLAGAGSD